MVVEGYGRGGGHDCGRGRDSEGGCGCRDKGPRHRALCVRNSHTSNKCWDKFGKPEWAQVANSTSTST